jgi:hypothetical protein
VSAYTSGRPDRTTNVLALQKTALLGVGSWHGAAVLKKIEAHQGNLSTP